MPDRKPTLIYALILLAIASSAGFWYFMGVDDERQARVRSSLDSGVAAFEAKDYEAVLSELQRVPSDHPEGWRARYYEGSAQIMLKDYSASVPLLEEAFALNPTHTRTMHALGVAHFKLGNLAMSKAYFARVLEVDPSDEEARGLMDIMASLERQQPGYSEGQED